MFEDYVTNFSRRMKLAMTLCPKLYHLSFQDFYTASKIFTLLDVIIWDYGFQAVGVKCSLMGIQENWRYWLVRGLLMENGDRNNTVVAKEE